MSTIHVFTNTKHLPIVVNVRKITKKAETVKVPVYYIIQGKRFRNIHSEYNYVVVPKGSFIVMDEGGNEFAISDEALEALYSPIDGTAQGENGRYEYTYNQHKRKKRPA